MIEANHSKLCRVTDQPIAGLLRDLKQLGLLDETLVTTAEGGHPTAVDPEGAPFALR